MDELTAPRGKMPVKRRQTININMKRITRDKKLTTALKGIYDSLTDEQKEKAKKCKTMDELMKLAGEWGLELPDELLDNVNGGYCIYDDCWELI